MFEGVGGGCVMDDTGSGIGGIVSSRAYISSAITDPQSGRIQLRAGNSCLRFRDLVVERNRGLGRLARPRFVVRVNGRYQ